MKRKLITITLTVCMLVVCVAGCGNKSGKTSSTNSNYSEEDTANTEVTENAENPQQYMEATDLTADDVATIQENVTMAWEGVAQNSDGENVCGYYMAMNDDYTYAMYMVYYFDSQNSAVFFGDVEEWSDPYLTINQNGGSYNLPVNTLDADVIYLGVQNGDRNTACTLQPIEAADCITALDAFTNGSVPEFVNKPDTDQYVLSISWVQKICGLSQEQIDEIIQQ